MTNIIETIPASQIIEMLEKKPGSRPIDLVMQLTCDPLTIRIGTCIMKDNLRILYKLERVDRKRDHKRRYVYYAKDKA